MKTRIKTKIPAINSRAEMEMVAGEVTSLKLAEQHLVTGMEQEIADVRNRYEARLAETRGEMQSRVDALMTWSEAHPDEFGKAKSLETIHGQLGWRTGTPALKTLSGWTWDRVLEKLGDPGCLNRYIRTKIEVDKLAILADRSEFEVLTGFRLAAIGVRVTQEETFFFEPRIESVAKRETSEVAA